MTENSRKKQKESSGVKMRSFLFVLAAVSLFFAMGIVRGQCINVGYDLSRLADEVEKRRIDLENAEDVRSKQLNKDILFSKARDNGFVLMNEGKTFNVQ